MDKKGKFNFISMDELDKITVDLSKENESKPQNEAPKKRGRKKKSVDEVSEIAEKTTVKKEKKESSKKEKLVEEVIPISKEEEEPVEKVVDSSNEVVEIERPNSETIEEVSDSKVIEESVEEEPVEDKIEVFEIPLQEEIVSSKKNILEEREEVVEEAKEENISSSDNLSEEKEETVDEVKEEIVSSVIKSAVEEKEPLPKKFYFGFEARVISMVLGCVLLFVMACIFMVRAMDFVVLDQVSYSENSSSQYQVCLKENNLYNDSCLRENMQYTSSLVDAIRATFRYETKFSSDVPYRGTYSIIAVTKMVDANNSEKVLYENEEMLVNKKNVNSESNAFVVEDTVNIDYNKYLSSLSSYKQSGNVKSSLEVSLYVSDGNETRKVSSLNMGLSNETFKIGKMTIRNDNRKMDVYKNEWSSKCTLYAVLSVISSLLALVLLFKITKLVLVVTTNRNKYQKRLDEILRDYDRLIVIARNGYISSEEKEVVKVQDFNELLDARDTLEKPIIFSRVNDIKSEFIVEDEDKIYKYVLKEADL